MAVNQHNVIRKGLLVTILLFLWLIILQDLFELKQVNSLFGYFPPTKDTIFTFQSWKRGRFQLIREEYLQKEFSLREDYVRFHNSMRYGLFHRTQVKWIVFGKDDQLLGTGQIDSYLGNDSLSDDVINRKAFYLSEVEDTLDKLGKKIYTNIPPNKLEIFPEYLPASYPKKTHLNNYEKFAATFKRYEIEFIDFVEYFKQLKASGITSLFPKNGSHWNYYGGALAMKYFLEQVNRSGMFKVGDLEITDAFYEPEKDDDPDIFAAMNLMSIEVSDTTLYPVCKIKNVTSKKPRTIFISDSFFNAWVNFGIYDLFDSVTYYFYNNRILNKDRTETNRKFTCTELLENYDMFVIMCHETNLPEFCWGFVEQMYFHFYPFAPNRAYFDPEFRNQVYQKINEIKKDEPRYNRIKELNKPFNQPIEQRLYEEAVIDLHKEMFIARKANGI